MESVNIRYLLICFCGIFISYLLFGLEQEKITKTKYGPNKDKFVYFIPLVFIQCMTNVVFARIVNFLFPPNEKSKNHNFSKKHQTLFSAMSLTYIGAMLASNTALKFIDYPSQVVGKSLKPICVLMMGAIFARKKYSLKKIMYILTIVCGVILFISNRFDHTMHQKSFDLNFGHILLIISLLLDGATGSLQHKLRDSWILHGEPTVAGHQIMLYVNMWATIFMSIVLWYSATLTPFLNFIVQNNFIIPTIITWAISSSIGQIFVFMAVEKIGPLYCSIITTTRKLFTILLSVLLYRNPMTNSQWFGTFLVFVGLFMDLLPQNSLN
ncbi:UDP-galactose transporter 1, partial [Intoshia linei]